MDIAVKELQIEPCSYFCCDDKNYEVLRYSKSPFERIVIYKDNENVKGEIMADSNKKVRNFKKYIESRK